MIRRPPRSTQSRSSAASDVYKRQVRGSSGEPRLNGHVLVCEVSAMSQDKTIPVSVIAFRAEDYSPDGKNVIISLTTKYSIADRKFSVPIECFHDLIVDLQMLMPPQALRQLKLLLGSHVVSPHLANPWPMFHRS